MSVTEEDNPISGEISAAKWGEKRRLKVEIPDIRFYNTTYLKKESRQRWEIRKKETETVRKNKIATGEEEGGTTKKEKNK